jgi:hypothetical protein
MKSKYSTIVGMIEKLKPLCLLGNYIFVPSLYFETTFPVVVTVHTILLLRPF